MIDYYRLISRAVAELGSTVEAERLGLYERARAALVSRLQELDPPLDEIRRTRERLALEETFRRVEARIEAAAERGLSFAEFNHETGIVAALGGLADALRQQLHGAQMQVTGNGALRFAVAPSAADRDIATDPAIAHNHADLRTRCAGLDHTVRQAPWRPRWAGLLRAVDILGTLLALPLPQLADRIGTMWSLVVSLRAYVEQSEDARQDSLEPDDPLEPWVLHAVRDFVFTAAPWVRRFPSGRSLDSDVDTWIDDDSDFEQAAALLQRVERQGLFGGDDAMIVAISLDAGRGGSVPAIRARSWARATICNIGIALVQALVAFARTRIGIAGATCAANAEVARVIEGVVVGGREELSALLSQLAPDIDIDAVGAALLDLAPLRSP